MTVVTRENYCRAETDRTFFNVTRMAGGVNRFFHYRSVTPLDKQTVIRMNKDTLYSGMVVDTSKGAKLTLPDMPAGRYFSVLLVDNDHYCPGVIYTPGVHELPRDTKYLFVIYPDGCMGPRGTADEGFRPLAAAGAWGLFPNKDAIYINYNGKLPADKCHTATYTVPENNAFWSITVYGADGYMKSANSVLNKFNTKFNDDGTFTAYFGSKEQCSDMPNRLDVTEGCNFLMRVYRPGPSVLNGSYKLPDARPV